MGSAIICWNGRGWINKNGGSILGRWDNLCSLTNMEVMGDMNNEVNIMDHARETMDI